LTRPRSLEVPFGRDGPRLDAELLGAAPHLRNPDRDGSELAPDLSRIRSDAMKSQQYDQSSKALIKGC
jgi:hypothetical protein